MLGWSDKLFFCQLIIFFLSHKSSSGLEVRLPAKFQPPERIASGYFPGWIGLGGEEQ